MVVVMAVVVIGVAAVARFTVPAHQLAKLPGMRKANKRDDLDLGSAQRRISRDERLPYRYVEDSPFFFISDHGVWTAVRLASKTDEFATADEHELSAEANAEMSRNLIDFFAARSGKREAEVVCHEIVRNQPIDTTDWLSRYHREQWDPSELFNTLLSEKIEPHIREAAPVRARYLLVRIGDQRAATMLDPVSRIVDASDGLVDEIFNRQELEYFRDLAGDVIRRLSPYGHEITRADLAWLIRNTTSGMFPATMERDYLRTRYARGSWFDEFADVHAVNLKRQAAVRISNPNPDDGLPDHCYVATLTVHSSEPVVPFQYQHAWAAALRSLPNPPAISWRYKLISEKLWTKKLKKATKSIEVEAGERIKDGNAVAIDDTKFGALAAQADDAKRRNDLHPQPGMVGQLRITISAWTLPELKQREQEIGDLMKQFVKLDRPKNIQQALLEEQLPGDFSPVNIGRVVLANDFKTGGGVDVGTRYTDVEILAMARLDSAPTVGDDMGFDHDGSPLGWHGHVIGYAAQNGAIVHFDPFVQIARNGGAGTAIIGASGSGKSSLSLSLMFYLSEGGVQTVVLDPKNDFEQFCLYVAFGPQVLEDGFHQEVNAGLVGTEKSRFQPINRRFWDDTRIVSLTNGNNGSLGPWLLTGDYESGETLARRQVAHLFSDCKSDDPRLDIIDQAFGALREDYLAAAAVDANCPLPSLGDLVAKVGDQLEFFEEILRKGDGQEIQAHAGSDRVRAVQTRLDRARRQDYSRLLFDNSGDAATQSERGYSHRRTIITMIGFKPPASAEEATGTEENRAAAAALYTVLWQVNAVFTASHPTVSPNRRRKDIRPRALIVDEAYVVTAFASGADLLKRSTRQGRSLNFAVIIISQQAHDINKIESASAGTEDEADQNQFGTIFCFAQKGTNEASAALKLLRSGASITPDEEIALSTLLRPANKGGLLDTGVCVMKDFDNRVATVHIDMLFAELRRAAETNAFRKTAVQAEPISADGAEWIVNTALRDRMMAEIVRDRITDAQDELAGDIFEFGESESLLADA